MKSEEKEEKDEKEIFWKAFGEDLEGAIATDKPIGGRFIKWFVEKGFGFAEVTWLAKLCFAT